MRNLIPVHESKKSDKVIKFIDLNVDSLSVYCSKKYAKMLIDAHDNGSLWSVYFISSGKIRATFI